MKWLIIAVFIVAQQPAKAPERKGTAQPKATQSAEQLEKSDQGSGQSQPPVSVTVNNSLPSPNSDSSKEQSEENMQVQRRLTFYTGLLVIAGFVTAALICWQARETRRSVQAIRESLPHQEATAKAALLNAQAVINAERPWILIEYEWRKVEGLEGYLFFAVNKGKTPADIVEANFESVILNCIPDDLPLPPPTMNSPIFIPRRGDNLIVQGETWYLNQVPIHPESWIRNQMKLDEVMEAKAFPYFFGEIVYRDAIRPKGDEEGLHLTRCCFSYDAFMKLIRPTGPQEYRHKT